MWLLQELRELCLVLLTHAGLSRRRRASDLAGFNGDDGVDDDRWLDDRWLALAFAGGFVAL